MKQKFCPQLRGDHAPSEYKNQLHRISTPSVEWSIDQRRSQIIEIRQSSTVSENVGERKSEGLPLQRAHYKQTSPTTYPPRADPTLPSVIADLLHIQNLSCDTKNLQLVKVLNRERRGFLRHKRLTSRAVIQILTQENASNTTL
ncbi:hypothetical protein YC2023_049358 [Brassica napus]